MSDQGSANTRQAMAPSGVAALILGITASCVGWSFGIPGIIVGAIGMNISRKARGIFDANPGKYRGERFIKEGMKWSRIGLIQGIILTVFWVLYYVFIIGFTVSHYR
jgi:hypothetical protein